MAKLGFVIVVFLDIKGAFDYVKNKSILEALRARPGTRDTSIKWFEDFLANRNIQISIKDIKVKKYCARVTCGCHLVSLNTLAPTWEF